jgi:predicted nucleic acid-binding protein
LSYVDTSILIASLDPDDHRRNKVRDLLEQTEYKVVSELVITELASVIARRRKLLSSLAEHLNVSQPLLLASIILYIMKRFNLKYKYVENYKLTAIGRMYKPIGHAVELAPKLNLKTLDLLHLGYLKTLKIQGVRINTLLTADTDFAKYAKEIEENIGVHVHAVT